MRKIVKSGIVLMFVGIALYPAGAQSGKDNCVTRPPEVDNNCVLGQSSCSGGCTRYSYQGCNDCIEVPGTCPPATSQCTETLDTDTCIRNNSFYCGCDPNNWHTGRQAPANQGCD